MNFKLYLKLIRRFQKIAAGEGLDESDQLTEQELRDCRHMPGWFYAMGDAQGFEALAMLAIADIYGAEGSLDVYIDHLIRLIRRNVPEKEHLMLLLGLLKSLPRGLKPMANLRDILGLGGPQLTPYQENQLAALNSYAQLLGDEGARFIQILGGIAESGNTNGLIGQPPAAAPKISSDILLKCAIELKCRKIIDLLLEKQRQMPALDYALGGLCIGFLKEKKYGAARFLLKLDLPFRICLKGRETVDIFEFLLCKNRREGLEILLGALPALNVGPLSGQEYPVELIPLKLLKKHGPGRWGVCELLGMNLHIQSLNGIELFSDQAAALELCKEFHQKILILPEVFEKLSFAEQYQFVKARAENEGKKYGTDPYLQMRRELKPHPELFQIFCADDKFNGPKLLLRRALASDNVEGLSLASPAILCECLASNIKSHSITDLAGWNTDEKISNIRKSLLLNAFLKGSVNYLHWLEENIRLEGKSPLRFFKERISGKHNGKYWPVALRFLVRSAAKPMMIFLLKCGFIEEKDLPGPVYEALAGDMPPALYALHFHAGQAAWQGIGFTGMPDFMWSCSPCGFDVAAYNEILILTRTAAAMAGAKINNDILKQAFKLAVLFGTPEGALEYIQKYATPDEPRPFHRLCQFDLPAQGFWNPREWRAFVMEFGPRAARWVVFAPYFALMGLGVPRDLTVAQKIVVDHLYGLQGMDPGKLKDFAELCASYQIDPKDFATCLEIINKGLKTRDNLPNLTIIGEKIGIPGYYLTKLPCGDLRGFMLGKITNCCQYVGSDGGSCAITGMTDENSGFYVVCKITGDVPDIHQDQIIAQLWAWIGPNHVLVMDSWERLRAENNWMCQRFLSAMCNLLQPGQWSDSGIRRFVIGGGGETPQYIHYGKAPFIEKLPFSGCYSDAKKVQLGICDSQNLELKERHALLDAATAIKVMENAASFLVKMSEICSDVWARNMGHLLNTQNGIEGVEIFTCLTLEGVPHFLITLQYHDVMSNEFQSYQGYSRKGDFGELSDVAVFKF